MSDYVVLARRWAAIREVVSVIHPSACDLSLDLHAMCVFGEELEERAQADERTTARLLATSAEAIAKSRELLVAADSGLYAIRRTPRAKPIDLDD